MHDLHRSRASAFYAWLRAYAELAKSGKHVRASASADEVRRRLRTLRVAKGMSQAELARRTNMATSTLSRLESGERCLTIDHLTPLAAVLGVSVGELIGPTATSKPAEHPSSDPLDLDLRRLRYFVVLAEHLHFGRAAERLNITQPVLSRQIRRLEQDVGVDLLLRSSRHVELTVAGHQLVEDAETLLASAKAIKRRVRDAATGQAGLTVGFLVGDPIIQLILAFDAMHPAVDVDVKRIQWSDQPRALLEDHVNVSFVHLPMDDDGLDLAHLYSLPMMALLPTSHRLAGRSQIVVREVAGDPIVEQWGANAIWGAWRNVGHRRERGRSRSGPAARNVEESIEMVGTGRGISFVPISVTAAIQIPREVTAIPVVDLPPAQVCLACKAGRRSDAIRDLVATAQATLTAGSVM